MLEPELEMQVDALCTLDTTNGPTEDDIVDLYSWIDSLDFSRPKKNITRDFSDGVLMAELVSFYQPSLVEVRSYYAALSRKNKENNWEHLNIKVLSKLGLKIEKQTLQDVMDSKPGAIEKVLYDLRPLLAKRNRTILDYRRNPIKKTAAEPPQKAIAKFSSQIYASQPKKEDHNATPKRQNSRSRHSSSEIKKAYEVFIPPSLLKPTLASANRGRSRTKDSRDGDDETRARVEKLLEERSKSIKAQSRPGSRSRNSSRKSPAILLGGHQDVVATKQAELSGESPTTRTTSVFLTEEYILSGSSGMSSNVLNHVNHLIASEGDDNEPRPAVRKDLFGLV